mmetsp:Transcript_9160/g.21997  ORF Transcript_9160/g.21997 Transcript_9160/m.21997 type:complete len:271 (+) Transcript_9160:109-921(+)
MFSHKSKTSGQSTASVYLLFGCCAGAVYNFVYDGGFSAVMTLSSAVQTLAFLLLCAKVYTQNTAAGVSARTLQMYVAMYAFRLSSTLFFNGYLPMDQTGDWAYQASDIAGLVTVLWLLRTIRCGRLSWTYQWEHDTHPVAPVVGACFALAVLVHPTLNNWAPADIAWTTALYIDAVALLPQLWMMTRIGGEVEALTAHFVAAVCVSRFLNLIFWYHGFPELAPADGGFNSAGWAIILAHLLQLFLACDFLYYYAKSVASGRLVLPVSVSV